MFITVHAAAAAVIGRYIPNPIVGFFVGLISHYLLDIPPHGDQKLGRNFFGFRLKQAKESEHLKSFAVYGTLDGFFLALFLIFLFKNFDFVRDDAVIWTIVGGILPDIIMILHKATDWKALEWISEIHAKNHMILLNRIKSDMPLQWGVLMQTTIMAILVWVLLLIR